MKTIVALAVLALAQPAMAQDAHPGAPMNVPGKEGHIVRQPPLALAIQGAQAAIDACKAHGYLVGATVVDDDAGVRASLAADGAPTEGPNGSRRKAVTSAMLKMPGAELAEKIKTDANLAAKVKAMPESLARAGAWLIKARDGQIVGVIGVEGNPHDLALNDACAKAGADFIQSRLK